MPHTQLFARIARYCMCVSSSFRGSSVVEQATVNRLVAGSIPARGATKESLPRVRSCKLRILKCMQQNYSYIRTEKPGENFHPDFKPHLTPEQMLEMGVFGGLYFSDTPEEFPDSWWKNAKLSPDGKRHKDLNYYHVNASQPLTVWRHKGWIHSDDPRGWFQWYCRYYLGRRHDDDERQIRRWNGMARHAMQIVKNCRPGDSNCRPKQRQALLHWAYDTRNL